ncbi:hypothetical protein VB620_07040 [Nodularia harveyana UHCC-0300]|uniref:Uncharacterized protein n=1 Tax=Nodularia harveyana UHCC-0300 TaxID=2974287 RepID=A0ABU5UD59_9CYAN|nr:hypothetical protein [Nodularia harveyana]MEA5581094.1 hypothetical protein [Nodularia harveyana UHCC-0300]
MNPTPNPFAYGGKPDYSAGSPQAETRNKGAILRVSGVSYSLYPTPNSSFSTILYVSSITHCFYLASTPASV